MRVGRVTVSTALSYLAVTAYAVLSLYPFLWMASSALKSNQEVLSNRSLIPRDLHFDALLATWQQLEVWRYLANSVLVTTATVAGIVIVYSLAGYGFALTSFWGRDVLFLGFLALLLVPGVTILVPLVQLLRALGLTGRGASQLATYTGLVVPMINGAGPFSIFLFRGYFASLPRELHAAARVDGCSEFGIYRRVYLPLAWPVIATVSILNMIATWNAYIWPSIVLNRPEWFTLPLKLKDLDLQSVPQWNVRMAGSLITVIPIIIVFLFLQRYYIRGLTAGALKG